MDLNEYQKRAMETCMPTSNNVVYMGFNLAGEVGELLGKLAKAVRKDKFIIYNDKDDDASDFSNDASDYFSTLSFEEFDEIKKEAGDCLWQIAGICHVLGLKLDDVGQDNLDKLASRKKRGVIDGNGDNR